MTRVILALLLVTIAWASASESKHWRRYYDDESDIAWIPVAIWYICVIQCLYFLGPEKHLVLVHWVLLER